MDPLQTLAVSEVAAGVLHVQLNRPNKGNAMNALFWAEIKLCFEEIAKDSKYRAVVISGAGKFFTGGLDLSDPEIMKGILGDGTTTDSARRSLKLRAGVRRLQDSFSVISNCPIPVIAAVHSACVGGGVDLISACDIRFCSADAWFSIKEVQIGLCADVGTLQRLPKIVGNDSLVRELAFTGRKFSADDALRMGLVSRVCADREEVLAAAIATASEIAAQSPVAVVGTKRNLNYARDHSVRDGLEYVATWNAAMLQTADLGTAVQASMAKKKALFANL